MFIFLYALTDYGILLLRLALGAVMVVHGWPKLKDQKTTASNFNAMGFRPGIFWGTLVAVVEFFGGLALILGFYTQIAAVLIAGEFLVINIWKISKGQPLSGGYEFDLVILGAAIALITWGGGAFAAEKYLL